MKLKLNGHDVDLQKALPLTLGDLEEIQKLGLIDDGGEMNVAGPSNLIDLLHYLAHKADDKVERDSVRDIPINHMKQLGDWAQKALAEDEKADRPS
jgi:hypothetical protein